MKIKLGTLIVAALASSPGARTSVGAQTGPVKPRLRGPHRDSSPPASGPMIKGSDGGFNARVNQSNEPSGNDAGRQLANCNSYPREFGVTEAECNVTRGELRQETISRADILNNSVFRTACSDVMDRTHGISLTAATEENGSNRTQAVSRIDRLMTEPINYSDFNELLAIIDNLLAIFDTDIWFRNAIGYLVYCPFSEFSYSTILLKDVLETLRKLTPVPTALPTSTPSSGPSRTPSSVPSTTPSSGPSGAPTPTPSSVPSTTPSSEPTALSTSTPSSEPTAPPTPTPSSGPSGAPSSLPTPTPSSLPTEPSSTPSSRPTSSEPSVVPSSTPSSRPTSSEPSDYEVLLGLRAFSVESVDGSGTRRKLSRTNASSVSSGPTASPSDNWLSRSNIDRDSNEFVYGTLVAYASFLLNCLVNFCGYKNGFLDFLGNHTDELVTAFYAHRSAILEQDDGRLYLNIAAVILIGGFLESRYVRNHMLQTLMDIKCSKKRMAILFYAAKLSSIAGIPVLVQWALTTAFHLKDHLKDHVDDSIKNQYIVTLLASQLLQLVVSLGIVYVNEYTQLKLAEENPNTFLGNKGVERDKSESVCMRNVFSSVKDDILVALVRRAMTDYKENIAYAAKIRNLSRINEENVKPLLNKRLTKKDLIACLTCIEEKFLSGTDIKECEDALAGVEEHEYGFLKFFDPKMLSDPSLDDSLEKISNEVLKVFNRKYLAQVSSNGASNSGTPQVSREDNSQPLNSPAGIEGNEIKSDT